jgi:hypothetical protein
MTRSRIAVTACLALACAPRSDPVPGAAPVVSCAPGDSALVRDVVYFGRNRPGGGTVSDTEWQGFLDQVVTPRFPGGFSVVEATGQWKGRSGVVERERSEMLTLLHTGSDADRRAVAELAAEYKRRFHQEAVLRERTPACARFE